MEQKEKLIFHDFQKKGPFFTTGRNFVQKNNKMIKTLERVKI